MKNLQTKISLLVVLFALLGNAVLAQAPGYLGKRWMVNYALLFSPQLEYEGSRYRYNADPILPLNTKHLLCFERVLSRNFSLGLEGGLRFTGYQFDEQVYRGAQEAVDAKIIVPTLGFSAKFHRFHGKGTLAPLGPYLEIVGRYGWGTGTLKTMPERITRRMADYVMPCLGFGLGNHWLVGESFLVDFGFQLVITQAFVKGSSSVEDASFQVGEAMSREEVINFKLGFGWLGGKQKN